MDADGEACRAVVGEHPLPHGRLRQVGRRRGRLERQRQLLLLATGARDRLRARHEPQLPEQLPAGHAEAVARTGDDQRLETVLRQLRALCEVAHARERAGALALRDDGLRVVLADAVHVVEADAHGAVLDRAFRSADVHVGRARLDAAALAVAYERRRRIEAHRLRVQQRAEELRGDSDAAARRTGTRADRTQRHATSGSRSRRSRRACRTPCPPSRASTPLRERTGDEAAAVRLERVVRALAAHRTAQSFRLPHAEARERDRDLEHLVLEDDDAERRAQAVGEQRMVDRRHERRVLAQALPVLDVRVHRLALDRPGPDERDLHRQVVEVLRQRAQQALHLRAALDLEVADGVRALDVVVDGLVVERDAREVDRLARAGSRSARRSPRRRRASRARAGRS